jgi:hypothetical protein
VVPWQYVEAHAQESVRLLERMAFTCRASMLVTMLGTSYDIEIVTGVVLRSCSNIA